MNPTSGRMEWDGWAKVIVDGSKGSCRKSRVDHVKVEKKMKP